MGCPTASNDKAKIEFDDIEATKNRLQLLQRQLEKLQLATAVEQAQAEKRAKQQSEEARLQETAAALTQPAPAALEAR